MNVYLWELYADEIIEHGWERASPIDVDGVSSILLTDRPTSIGTQTSDTSGERLLTLAVPDELFIRFERPASMIRESLIPIDELLSFNKPVILADEEQSKLWENKPWLTETQKVAEHEKAIENKKMFHMRMVRMKEDLIRSKKESGSGPLRS